MDSVGSAARERARDGARRSPLDLIMNQIRRKRSDRRPFGRLLSWTSDRNPGREQAEPEEKPPSSDVAESVNEELDVGWGRIRAFLHKLGKDTERGRMNLSHCDLTSTDLLELSSLLPYVPRLEHLDLSWNDLIGGSVCALTSQLGHMTWICSLRLSGCRLRPQDITALGDALSCLPSVEVLDLSWNRDIGDGGLQGLVGKVQPPLTELHLVACELTAADGPSLGALLSPLSHLSLLNVSCNPCLADGVKDLCSALSKTISLKVLRLQRVGLSPRSLQALGDCLELVPSLRLLDLSCNKGLSDHLSIVSSRLTHLSLLESLDLHLNDLMTSDLLALVHTLPSLISLTELNVSSNQEVADSVHAVVSALPLSHMRSLPLNNCSLSHSSYTAFVLAVPFLLSVDLSWCKEVGGRLSVLLDALQPSVLQELRLSSCDLTTDDVQHLALACRGGFLSSLQILDLSYNGCVGANGWSGLLSAAGLGGLASLEELDLSLRPRAPSSCSEWLPALLQALPGLTALKMLGLQRWTSGEKEKLQLDHRLKRRNVRLEMDDEEVKESPEEEKEVLPEE